MSTTDQRPDYEPQPELALAKNAKSKPSRIVSWALWDWGTQPFYTVITTFVFTVYLTTPQYFAWNSNTNGPTQALSISTTICGVIIALIAPVLGQSADRSGHLVRNMRLLTWVLAAISMALWFVAPHPAYLILGLVLLAVGTIVGEISSSFYNATIDQVATEKNVGKVSGFGWGMGYMGGILVLLVILFVFIQPEVGLFGITDTPTKIRASMIVCGLWTLIWTIPTFLTLRDRPQVSDDTQKLGIWGSYMALFRSIVHIWRTERQVAYFLLASALYRDGLAAVFTFGAVIAAQSFGFSTTEIILFGAAANLIAGVVTILFGLLDDKIGPKKVILICLAILAVGATIVFFLHQPAYSEPQQLCAAATGICTDNPNYDAALVAHGKVIFWVFGLILSCLCGPAQAASRSFLARIIPEGHSGEIFGLYTTTGRVISFFTPALVALLIPLGKAITGQGSTQHWALLAIAIVLAAGFCVLTPVKPSSGAIGTASTPKPRS